MNVLKTKILHIPNYYPPHIGGIEGVCYSIVTALPEFEHQVICFHDQKETVMEMYEGIQVIRCGVWKKLFSQSVSFSFYKELKRIFKTFDPDIVHFHTPNPLSSVYLLALLPKKVKLLVHWHSDIIEQNLLYFFYHPIEKQLLKLADKVMVTSPSYIEGSKALSLWHGKLTVIPNTVDTNQWKSRVGDDDAIEEIRNRYKHKKIIFTCGRHVPYKGLRCLIDAGPLISDNAVVVIAGKGPMSDELKKSADSLKTVYFTGRLSDDELRWYLYASDIYAFPSITRNEAFGVALAEAMYCGLPAVTFTIPFSGVNWLCPNEETGLESENGNVQALAGAINRLLSEDDLRAKLGVNATQRIKENFTIEAIKERVIDLYK
jgi:glycosyltransferase involved in cell wall biosynthesis